MSSTYLIGEIGQNHNGSVEIAKLLAEIAARPVTDHLFQRKFKGFNAIKLTKRDLSEELAQAKMNEPYNSPHSFGTTYGEHRSRLELSDEEHFEVYTHAKKHGIDFVETLCAVGCLSLLKLFTPDYLKVASRDLTNLPLLAALAETQLPVILSTGMAGQEELDIALKVITRYHSRISILHCVSEYPTQYEHVNLNTIPYLKARYPRYPVGYSDHTIGISIPVAAIAAGAMILEKHITVDRKMKGTDQASSLGIDGIERMVRDIRNLELALGEYGIFAEEAVIPTRLKLERSIASTRLIEPGEVITEQDIHLLSPGDGFKWLEKDRVVGKRARSRIPANEIIYPNLIS
ncbi:N-acetylneuraminate synthase family protein [Puia sp.]|jgi:sialic acid synthase|uniref:N-acetylneuraminate synthase family protein n=1 Tax=Puia sp. TaxID=2045100 RepID=UPI002F3E58B9